MFGKLGGKKLNEKPEDIDKKYFGPGSSTADYAIGLSKLFNMTVEKLAERGDKRTIAKLCAFLFANFYDEVDMSYEEAHELQILDPSIPILRDPGSVEYREFEELTLLQKTQSLKFLLDPIMLDILQSEYGEGERKLKNIGRVIYGFCREAVDRIQQTREETLRKNTPDPKDLENLWKE